MRTVRTMVMVALVLAMACSVSAAEKKKGEKKGPADPMAQRIQRMTEGLTLTAEQKTKIDAIAKEMAPKFEPLTKKLADILTPEQQKAQAEAMKAATDAGKKGKELFEARAAAVTLTDQQKAEQAKMRKEMDPLVKELQEKVMAVLTPEQKQEVEKKLGEVKKKGGEGKKKAAK